MINRKGLQEEVWIKTLRARGFSREFLLDRENTGEEQTIITFNLIFYPFFQNVKKFLAELHLLFTPDVVLYAVLTNVPRISFKNDSSLKDPFVWTVLPKIDAEGRSKLCGRKKSSYDVCKSLNDTSHLKGETSTRHSICWKDHMIAILIMLFIYLNANNVNIAFFMWAALKLSLGTE